MLSLIVNKILSETDIHITVECCGCKSVVKKYKKQILSTSKHLFCTLACRNKNYKKVRPEWNHSSRVEYHHVCEYCNNNFTITGSSFKPKVRRFCSRKCQANAIPRKSFHTDETKAKLSIAATKQNKAYKGSYLYSGLKGEIDMRSSWEVKYAEWLDSEGIDWQYEPTFKLSNGKLYTPDFKLDDGTIVEIKGYFRDDAREKWELFEDDYPDINKQLLMKSELKELGVL